MADVVTSQTLHDTHQIAVMKFTNLSDGSGESNVLKVDVSALATHPTLATVCTRVAIERMWYSMAGMTVDVLWDATANVAAWTIGGDGYLDFRSVGPIVNNAGSGITGDILFSTIDATNGDRYSIMLALRKTY